MRRKILIIVITFLLLVTFSINVFSDNEITNSEIVNEVENKTLEQQQQEIQDKITESNNKLEYVQSELTTSLQKIQELDDSIAEYEKQYNELQNQISELENQIKNTNIELGKIENEYAKKENTLKKRVVALYESGDATYLDVLLSSRSIVEFLSNYFMIEQIIEFDNNLLEELEDKRHTIELKKAEQEKRDSSLRIAKTKANQMQILMQNNRILQENYSSKLTEEEQALNEQIVQYKEEQASIERQIQAAIGWSGSLAIQYTGGAMIWPVGIAGTYITSGYGGRLHPIQGVYKYHDGIDIGNAGFGAPVVAAADGVVTYAGVMGGYGNCVMINHGDGIVTLYGHGQEIKTTLGATVKQGDIIMLVGSTGNSTGPHLHFEVRKNGISTDPIPYLQGDNEESDTSNNN